MPPDSAAAAAPPFPAPSRSWQRLAHELQYYNLDAPQLDERLRPAEPGTRLLLLGGQGVDGGPAHHSKWLQCFDRKAGGWGVLGDMAVGRPCGCGAAAVGAYLYAFGGEGDDVVQPGCMTMYIMATRKMEEAAKPPLALQYCTGVACGGLVYSLGGWNEALHARVADVCVYNPDIDVWVIGPALPLAMYGLAAAEHSGCIYACGGWNGVAPALTSGSLLMLDPRTRSWASLPAMPTPVGHARAAVVAGRMYVPGGGTREAGRVTALPTLQCYDLVAGRWDTGCAPMAEARADHGVATSEGEVWAVGGAWRDAEQTLHARASVEVYSPQLNTWRAGVPLPLARYHGTSVVVQC